MFFLALPCFCKKPVSPSPIRFLLFGLFMHKVAIIDYSWKKWFFCNLAEKRKSCQHTLVEES